MAMPKTIVTRQGDIEFRSNFDLYKYSLKNLSRAANRDVGKLLLKATRKKIRRRKGRARRNLQYWNKKDGVLQIGYKRGIAGFYASLFEHGFRAGDVTYKDAPLLITAEEELANIQKIFEYYLAYYMGNPTLTMEVNEEISDAE